MRGGRAFPYSYTPVTPINSFPGLYQRDAVSRPTCFTRAIVGGRWAIDQPWNESSLARSLAPSSVLIPSHVHGHIARTYGIHVMYVGPSLSPAGHTWLTLIYVCAAPALCAAPAGKGGLFVTRTVNCVIGSSPSLPPPPLPPSPSPWSLWLSLTLYV